MFGRTVEGAKASHQAVVSQEKEIKVINVGMIVDYVGLIDYYLLQYSKKWTWGTWILYSGSLSNFIIPMNIFLPLRIHSLYIDHKWHCHLWILCSLRFSKWEQVTDDLSQSRCAVSCEEKLTKPLDTSKRKETKLRRLCQPVMMLSQCCKLKIR